MFTLARRGFRFLPLILSFFLLLSLAACNNKKEQPDTAQGAPKIFASPTDAGKALVDATSSQSADAIQAIFGSGSKDILSTGDAAEDKAAMEGFTKSYQAMNRWRKLADGSQLLIVGADNQPFPIPLMKNAAGQYYFDAAAGKEEILARRIGRDELAAIDVCAALADSQHQYFAQKHGDVMQYAQKFISDSGQQNGLYWESPQGTPRSPLGPLVAFATQEGMTIKPNAAQPFYGYYFRQLDAQGSAAPGGAKAYVVNGKMTGGFAYIAYPEKYGDSGIKTFMINQDGLIYQKDLGQDTVTLAKSMSAFNPDQGWTALK